MLSKSNFNHHILLGQLSENRVDRHHNFIL